MVLLFEKALACMRHGIQLLEAQRVREARPELVHASRITEGLLASLKPSVAPDLCQNLARTYIFVFQRLMVASLKGDVGAAREAERVFQPVAAAFIKAGNQVRVAP